MNQKTDNMYIDDRYSDEALRKREEIREHISWFREFLTFGTSLPEHIRRRYGLEEDYQRYKKLEIQVHRMPAEPDCRGYGKEQRMKELCEAVRAKGKITLAVEKAYESICPAPARDYLEEKYQELPVSWCRRIFYFLLSSGKIWCRNAGRKTEQKTSVSAGKF